MKKIPCLFVRDFHGHNRATIRMIDETTAHVTPGCEWVMAGEGTASRKWDGTACAVIDGKLYKRYDAKRGKQAPTGAIPCSEPDPVTGHHPHWIAVGDEPESWMHREAWAARRFDDATYELVGPKVNGNPDRFESHVLVRHGDTQFMNVARTFSGIRTFLDQLEIEGLVFTHPDGRMCKIRRADFGFRWPIGGGE